MAISRGICAVLVAVTLSAAAQAAIMGTTTLQREPAALPFGSPDAALAAPWVSYTLGLQGDAGEVIAAVDVSISGQLHQRWTFDEDLGTFNPTPNNNVNITNGDSKLRAVTGAIFGAGPFEDNPGTGSPLPDTATADYGVGTTLSGAWGIPVANQGSQVNLAYIVIPKGSEVNTDIRVKIAGQDGGILAELLSDAFPGFGEVVTNNPPIVDDKAVEYTSVHPSTIVSETLALSDPDGPPGTWSLDSFTSPNGQPASVDPTTGLFTWLGNGTPEGVYNAVLKYTDGGGLSDTGTLAITWHIPEPSSFALLGLALVGFAGCRRK